MTVTETKTVETQRVCPSCDQVLWFIEIGTKEEDQARFKWKRFFSTWSMPLALQYREHFRDQCKQAMIRKKKSEEMGFKEFDWKITEPNCLSCAFHEVSDTGFYCCNDKTEGSDAEGFHDNEEMVNGDGTIALYICKEYKGYD